MKAVNTLRPPIHRTLPEKQQKQDQAATASGLCTTCRKREGCGFAPGRSGAIWHCEEFECEGPRALGKAVTGTSEMEEGANLSRARAMGLCFNCENLETCRLPRPEGGVWHCEQYR